MGILAEQLIKGTSRMVIFRVPLRRQGPGGHHRRDGAAEANEHRHETAAGQTDLAQEIVHHEGHTAI